MAQWMCSECASTGWQRGRPFARAAPAGLQAPSPLLPSCEVMLVAVAKPRPMPALAVWLPAPPPPCRHPPATKAAHTHSTPPCCSGMSNEDIDQAVQQCKRDMFTMRIKFAKREVRAGWLSIGRTCGRVGLPWAGTCCNICRHASLQVRSHAAPRRFLQEWLSCRRAVWVLLHAAMLPPSSPCMPCHLPSLQCLMLLLSSALCLLRRSGSPATTRP